MTELDDVRAALDASDDELVSRVTDTMLTADPGDDDNPFT